jgi:hypothetical protein
MPMAASKTSNVGKVNFQFGGLKHGKDELVYEGRRMPDVDKLLRPEYVKSLACRDTGCIECTNKKACWYGDSPWGQGYLVLAVPADAPSDEFYVADFWARCSTGSGEWKVCPGDAWSNGDMSVEVNGQRLGSIGGYSSCVSFASKDAHVQIKFRRSHKDYQASASAIISAERVDASVESCMSVKDCLKILGDGSAASFALRNSNRKQYECIAARDYATRNAISVKCPPWVQCLSQDANNKKRLEVFLRAAVITPMATSLAAMAGKITAAHDKESSCVDPETDDAESWNCDCMEYIARECGDMDEVCFRGLMCKHSEICCSWKQTHCPAADHCSSSLAILKTNSSNSRADTIQGDSASLGDRSKVTSNIDSSLDQSLSGKCSQ